MRCACGTLLAEAVLEPLGACPNCNEKTILDGQNADEVPAEELL